MYSKINIIIILTLSILMSNCNTPKPPKAAIKPKELTIHNDTRIDNYYWLRDRENPEVISYLEAENEYTSSILKDTEKLQETLFNEIVGRIKKDDQSVPYKKRGYFYYVRYAEGSEYPIYCRKKGDMDNEEEILLDVNKLAKGKDYCNVSGVFVSPDTKIMAYGVDYVSRRQYTLYFKNLETGELFTEQIINTTGGVTFASDNKTIFYSTKDPETLRSNKIMRHKIGSSPTKDILSFEEKDETYSCGCYRSKSGEYIMIVSYASLSTEYRYIDASKPESEFTIFHPREKELEYSVAHYKDHFYIHTNLDAQNFRLMKTPLSKTTKENWEEIIPHRKDVYLNDMEIFENYLVLSERKEGLNHLRIIEWEGKKEHYLNFGEEVYNADFSINPEFESDILRYSYNSLTTPPSTYDYNMGTKEKTLLKEQEVLGDFNKENYEAKRTYAIADDGTKIPISLVYRKGLQKDGTNPCLLYGYGSYGITVDPNFGSARLSLLDRGFVFAIAHIRGGQIMGRQWYEDGKFLKKKNTFTDFIACAEHMINENYTNPNKMFAMGGSAGGLLMGAVVNIKPELFNGIIAAVPFVDVVTTMLDESIPLTTGEYDEWGNPNDKTYYEYMLSYSPYDNVKAQNYPNMLVTTGLHDSQVQYWEPAKWVAKLRTLKTDSNLLLLHTNMEAGHGGASGRFKRHKETALEYAFLLKLLN